MHRPRLSRTVILDQIARQLNFTDPVYTVRVVAGVYYEADVSFSSPREAGLLDTKQIYFFGGDPWETVEEAKDRVACRAISRLEASQNIRIQDYSYTVLDSMNERNHGLSVQIRGMAQVIVDLVPGWNAMAASVADAQRTLRFQVRRQHLQEIDDTSIRDINGLIDCVAHASDRLESLHEAMIKRMSSIHKEFDYDVPERAFGPLIYELPGIGTGALIILSNRMMLTQLLILCDCPVPTYEAISMSSNENISCCQFYSVRAVHPDVQPQRVCSCPLSTIEEANEDSSLQALRVLDEEHHMQLRDYNYHRKEKALTTNRDLLMKAQRFMGSIRRINFYWTENIREVSAIAEMVKESVDNVNYMPENTASELIAHSILDTATIVQQNLRQAVDKATSVFGRYDESALLGNHWFD